jgi:hypothetical protein
MNIGQLDVEKITALTLAACIVSGAPWSNLAGVFKNMEDDVRSSVIQCLNILLT